MQKLARRSRIVRCPKCGYMWRTKQTGYICCSRCKRYFGRYRYE